MCADRAGAIVFAYDHGVVAPGERAALGEPPWWIASAPIHPRRSLSDHGWTRIRAHGPMCDRRRGHTVAAMQDTAIRVHDLHKTYDGQPVLRGVSFAVGTGEIFGIAGRNGAGKTTTVEILQGLRGRDSGAVEVLGFDPGRDRKALRPLLGSQLQTSALPDRLRVGEALRLGFARLGGARAEWRQSSLVHGALTLY